MTRWFRAYWAEEDTWFYFEADTDGWITRQVELQGPLEKPLAAASLAEADAAERSGTLGEYEAAFGFTAKSPSTSGMSTTDRTSLPLSSKPSGPQPVPSVRQEHAEIRPPRPEPKHPETLTTPHLHLGSSPSVLQNSRTQDLPAGRGPPVPPRSC